MKAPLLLVLVSAASLCAAAADNPFGAFKGKIKPGMYEYKMEMDMGAMPGVPAGMTKQNRTFQQCVTDQDVEKSGVGNGRDGKMPDNCKVSNFKMAGNTASYTMTCKGGPDMTADNVITFASDGFKMDMKMAMNQRGQEMKMSQKMEGKYIGPCK